MSELLNKADIQPEIHELVRQKVYDNECKNAGHVICVVTFLPNIYDSSASERNNYLESLMKVAKKQRSQPFVFFWVQSGDQLDVERKLNMGFGYPAVVAISPSKDVFATIRASYSESNVNEFLTKVITGSSPTDKLPMGAMSELKKADKWDGKELYENGEVAIRVVKNANPSNPHTIDALSGATLTSNGVENTIRYWVGEQGFGQFLKNQAWRS